MPPPPNQVALARRYGQQYGVDPRLLLAIGGHETGWGTLGAGRQGYTLGYGVTDSGILNQYQGVENQYRYAASTLAKWGVRSLKDLLAGKAAAYASDPNWEHGVASAYASLGGSVPASVPSLPGSVPPKAAAGGSGLGGALPAPPFKPLSDGELAQINTSFKVGAPPASGFKLKTPEFVQPPARSVARTAPGTAQGGQPASGGYPLGVHGEVIGLPNQGSHTLFGNWQSDNAVDIAVPVGTPVYATQNGVIGNRIGALSSGDPHLEGLRVNLQGSGDSFYYAHLSRLAVHAGQHVKRGQLLGWSGAANGVAHLHFASESFDPRSYIGGHPTRTPSPSRRPASVRHASPRPASPPRVPDVLAPIWSLVHAINPHAPTPLPRLDRA